MALVSWHTTEPSLSCRGSKGFN